MTDATVTQVRVANAVVGERKGSAVLWANVDVVVPTVLSVGRDRQAVLAGRASQVSVVPPARQALVEKQVQRARLDVLARQAQRAVEVVLEKTAALGRLVQRAHRVRLVTQENVVPPDQAARQVIPASADQLARVGRWERAVEPVAPAQPGQ